jgi:hypothetical protein
MTGLGLDEGLLRRLRDAGRAIAWGPEGPSRRPRGAPTVRVARLRDEEARVAVREAPEGASVEVTAGPVGAVVLLLEADRRGPPRALGSRNGSVGSSFPSGSIVATWGPAEVVADARPTLRDLVELARYALP